jgi:hypothetical protein
VKIRVALRKAEAIIEDRDAEIERQRVLLSERDRQWADALSENERLLNVVAGRDAQIGRLQNELMAVPDA